MRRKLRPLAALAIAVLVGAITAGCSNAPAAATGSTAATSSTAAPSATATGPTATTAASTRTGTGSNAANAAPGGAAGTGSNSAANREQAVKFADCMRKNGVSKFPDPDASGQLTIDAVANGSSLDTDSPAFKQAISACKDLEPAGFTGHTRTPQEQANALKFAQCIRDNGVKDFPDPAPDAPLVDTNRIPSTAKSGGMSMLNAAMKKCRGAAADAGASGGQ